MNLLKTLWRRLRPLAQTKVVKREIDDELRFHVEQRTAENIAAGMTLEDAARAARKSFGNLQSVREKCREARGAASWEETWQDIRFGARQLRKNPGFTTVALLTLALGIGANTAIFSVVNSLLFRPLPFHDPQKLVWIANGDRDGGGLSDETTRVANFSDWCRLNQSFESLAAYFAFSDYNKYTFTSDGESVRLQGVAISGNFLDTLGVRPQLGRGFAEEECRWNGRKAILLTDAFWKRRFQGRPEVVGSTITLNNAATEVVGILPPAFDFSSIFTPGLSVDVVEPFPISKETDDWGNTLAVVGRLKPGVSLTAAQAEFTRLNQLIKTAHPERGPGIGARMTLLPQKINGQFRHPFMILFGVVGCVLLIACANLSNLLLARAMSRRKELAVRSALGAGRVRLVRQMLTESVLLSVCGAALGLPIALASVAAIARSHAFNIALLRTVGVDGTALGFTLVIAFFSALVFGLIPALHISGGNVQDSLKESSRGSSHGRRRTWIREALIVTEVALACLLMVGAGLLLRSFVRLIEIDPGFRPEQTVAWNIEPSRSFANPGEQSVYYQELVRCVVAVPGVESAGMSDTLPLGRNRSWGVTAKGEDNGAKNGPNARGDNAFPRIVDPGYIETMRILLRSGRNFDAHDSADGAAKVAVINETMARRLWPDSSAVGRGLLTGFTGDTTFQVVGVVGDVRHAALEEKPGPEMYLLGSQLGWGSEELVVRTKGSLTSVVPAVRAALHKMDPAMPLNGFRSLDEIVDQAVSPKRLIVMLLGLFSLLALILASVGIYGVISYAVNQRTPELGIRLALGASNRGILWLVIREGMKPVALGLLAGMAAALALTRVAQSLLFGISATDPLTYVANALLFIGVGLLACWLPARRAARVDPMVALRHE